MSEINMSEIKIILYSNGCPKCNVLKAKLKEKNITFAEENNDFKELISANIQSLPALKVNNNLLIYKEAIDWVNSLKQEN